jgi:integrase
VKHHHRVLSEALAHAVKWGLVGRNVAQAVTLPKPVNKEMQVLDGNGINRLLEAAQGTIYYPAIHLAVFTGMRRSEIFGQRWGDLEAGVLTVNQVLHVLPGGMVVFQEPKTARSKRAITLGPAAVLALKAHRERVEADRAMLGRPLAKDDLVFAEPHLTRPRLASPCCPTRSRTPLPGLPAKLASTSGCMTCAILIFRN